MKQKLGQAAVTVCTIIAWGFVIAPIIGCELFRAYSIVHGANITERLIGLAIDFAMLGAASLFYYIGVVIDNRL